MTPTNEQIIAEAQRRRTERGQEGLFLADFIIEVVRENWTPPEPVVDPDVLAWREWVAEQWPDLRGDAMSGEIDNIVLAQAYRAGAAASADRIKALEGRVEELEDRLHRMKYPRLRRRTDNGGGR